MGVRDGPFLAWRSCGRERRCFQGIGLWARQDSNLSPTDYESAALTTELRALSGEGYRRSKGGGSWGNNRSPTWNYYECAALTAGLEPGSHQRLAGSTWTQPARTSKNTGCGSCRPSTGGGGIAK
jgi:hypothetical protein